MIRSMERLRWTPAHEGNEGTLWAYDQAGRLVAQVAHYDVVAGRGPGWVGYRRGIRVTGRCTNAATAQRAVEDRVELRHQG